MKISESQLRAIIKKEIINEFFGPFRKNKEPKKMHFDYTKSDKVLKSLSGSRSVENLKTLLDVLLTTRRATYKPTAQQRSDLQIDEFIRTLKVKSKGQKASHYNIIFKAANGIDLFRDKVFPLVSQMSFIMKENIDLSKEDNMPFYAGIIFYHMLTPIDDVINVLVEESKNKNKFSAMFKAYYSTLSKEEKANLNGMMSFYAQTFRNLSKYDINDILSTRIDLLYPQNKKKTRSDDNQKVARMGEYTPSPAPSLKSANTNHGHTTGGSKLNKMNFDDLFDTGN